MKCNPSCVMNHHSPAQSGAAYGMLIFLIGPLNCIGYWTISIFFIIIIIVFSLNVIAVFIQFLLIYYLQQLHKKQDFSKVWKKCFLGTTHRARIKKNYSKSRYYWHKSYYFNCYFYVKSAFSLCKNMCLSVEKHIW